MIDGCFLMCLGRVLKNFIDEERIDSNRYPAFTQLAKLKEEPVAAD